MQAGLRQNDDKINGYILTFLAIATQKRAACLPAAGTSENNLHIQQSPESIRDEFIQGFLKESLIESEIPCGTGMCCPKYNNLAMT